MNGDTKTGGWIERRILHLLMSPEAERRYSKTATDIEDDTPRVAGASIRRAFGKLEDKGLVKRLDTIDEEKRHTLQWQRAFTTRSADDRQTDWVITDEGYRELVRRIDREYRDELKEVAKRHGRVYNDEILMRLD